uniref:Uncharacterized protein n=1 Tax=Lepeophtheirus salmonis TaxID=72036 RepID=A0A0K2U3V7_LEPSM
MDENVVDVASVHDTEEERIELKFTSVSLSGNSVVSESLANTSFLVTDSKIKPLNSLRKDCVVDFSVSDSVMVERVFKLISASLGIIDSIISTFLVEASSFVTDSKLKPLDSLNKSCIVDLSASDSVMDETVFKLISVSFGIDSVISFFLVGSSAFVTDSKLKPLNSFNKNCVVDLSVSDSVLDETVFK